MGFKIIRKRISKLFTKVSFELLAKVQLCIMKLLKCMYPVKHIFLFAAIRKRPSSFLHGEKCD